jgi:hypothetical protein
MTERDGALVSGDAVNKVVDDPAHLFDKAVVEVEADDSDETQENPGAGANGRLSDATKNIRDEGFKEIERMFVTLAQRTSIDISRLTSGFYRSFANKTVAFHSWNAYQIYFKDNRDAEVNRTYPSEKKAELVSEYTCPTMARTVLICFPDSSEVTVRQSCFDSFKRAHPKHWQDILSKYHDLHMFSAAGKTIAQRSRTFKKVCERLETLVRCSPTVFTHTEIPFLRLKAAPPNTDFRQPLS